MSKPIIAIDIDDVLAANAAGIAAWTNRLYGTSLTADDYLEAWGEMWGIGLEEAEERAQLFHDQGIAGELDHDPAAKPVLIELRRNYRLVLVTSRRISVESYTRQWIERHYAGLFDDLVFAGIFDQPASTERLTKTKASIFQDLDVAYVIDDQLKHCLAAAELGIPTLLFGDYPWNQAEILPAEIDRVADWPAVGRYFARQTVYQP